MPREVISAAQGTFKEIGRIAEKLREATKNTDNIDPLLDRLSATLDVGARAAADGHRVLLGGRAIILQGGKYHGKWFFPELAKGGKFPLFDDEIGRALFEKMKFDNPRYAIGVANDIKNALNNLIEATGRESRASMLFYGPRRIVRDFLDDTLRGVMTLGRQFVVNLADEIRARALGLTKRSILGAEFDADYLRQLAEPYGIYGRGAFASQVGQQFSAAGALAERAGRKLPWWHTPLSRNPIANFFRRQIERLDTIRRDAALRTVIEDELTKRGIKEASADAIKSVMPDVADRIDKSLYIYSRITPFEKKLSRYVMFYPFMRKNLPFWLNAYMEKPAHVQMIFRGFQYAGADESDVEQAWRKPYLQQTLTAKIGEDEAGRPVYLTGTGLSIENMEQMLAIGRNWGGRLQMWASALNPVFRIPLEQLAGKQFYFDTRIEDYRRAYEIMNQIPGLASFLLVQAVKDADVNIRRWAADGRRLYWLQQFKPVMDLIPVLDAVANKLGWQESTTSYTLTQALTTFATGLNLTTGDPQTWARVIQRDAMTKLLQEAAKQGKVGVGQHFFLLRGAEMPEDEAEFLRAIMERYQQTVRGQ